MALQGHPRSLILAPIESTYATSYSSSIVTLVLSCHVPEILQVFYWEQRPHPYSTRILGCSHRTRLPMLGLRWAKTLKQTAGQTDGHAHSALRGKNECHNALKCTYTIGVQDTAAGHKTDINTSKHGAWQPRGEHTFRPQRWNSRTAVYFIIINDISIARLTLNDDVLLPTSSRLAGPHINLCSD